ncbi:PQQ-dependent sugar dehydrogenase [Planctomycetes bacterium TBK1r]|uniref:DUF7133 domain-containing protein n=1 Tax=Stieleria magnilauensis TaxID=2527963 RepID=A0ABX5XQM1_9BACT|nr:hypothetical protein TBK1r_18530 [Planctomycetes bacterium TBK1r]
MNESLFLLIFVICSTIAILVTARPSTHRGFVAIVIGVIVLICGTTAIVAAGSPSQNLVVRLLSGRTIGGRADLAVHLGAACTGILAGLAVSVVARFEKKRNLLIASSIYLLAFMSFAALIAQNLISPYLADPNATGASGLVATDAAKGWQVRRIADLPVSPTAVAWAGDGKILVTGYAGLYFQNGAVVEVQLGTNQPSIRTVGRGLTRPHGLAYRDGEIFVSRAGQYAQAVNGRLIQKATGAVTRLRDLDGDGNYEIFEDIVSGLPGAQLPDGLHQNNGIAFDTAGRLYITVGTPTDHAPAFGKLDGTILRYSIDDDQLDVFAKGFRNPFGICFDHRGNLFCTDNDQNKSNPGDKLIHVVEGKHYGHPYDTDSSINVEDIESPIARLSSAQGLAFLGDAGTPIDNQLIVASFGDDALNSVELVDQDNQLSAKIAFLARIPSVVAVCCSPRGSIYACSYSDRGLYEVTFK